MGEFRSILQNYRRSKKISYEELGRVTNTSGRYWQRVLKERAKYDIEMVPKLSALFSQLQFFVLKHAALAEFKEEHPFVCEELARRPSASEAYAETIKEIHTMNKMHNALRKIYKDHTTEISELFECLKQTVTSYDKSYDKEE